MLLALLLLWPYDFQCWICTNGAAWAPEGEGISFASRGMLRSISPPITLHDRIAETNAFTVETWIATASLDQTGPARIVTYSEDPYHRNFTLGQDEGELVVRVRTTEPDPNGVMSELHVPDVFVAGELQHIVVTFRPLT